MSEGKPVSGCGCRACQAFLFLFDSLLEFFTLQAAIDSQEILDLLVILDRIKRDDFLDRLKALLIAKYNARLSSFDIPGERAPVGGTINFELTT